MAKDTVLLRFIRAGMVCCFLMSARYFLISFGAEWGLPEMSAIPAPRRSHSEIVVFSFIIAFAFFGFAEGRVRRRIALSRLNEKFQSEDSIF